jgi:hydroxymethylpyrimidine pyrophosphatase-like HAD family hydrolase
MWSIAQQCQASPRAPALRETCAISGQLVGWAFAICKTASVSRTPPQLPSNVRLVATDLDGTLLRSDGTISTRTRLALAALGDAGVGLVFVTARPPRFVDPIAEMTGHLGDAICSNGAITYDLRAAQILERCLLRPNIVAEAVCRLQAAVPEGKFGVETGDEFICEPGYMRHQWDTELDAPTATVEELAATPGVKLLFGCPGWALDDLAAVVAAAVGDLLVVTHSNPERVVVELSARGVSKATTLARMCEARSIAREQVIAFGDMPNDLPMLHWAGKSVAVASAHADVLAAVDIVTASNDEDGVARVLEAVIGETSRDGASR